MTPLLLAQTTVTIPTWVVPVVLTLGLAVIGFAWRQAQTVAEGSGTLDSTARTALQTWGQDRFGAP